MPVHGPIAGIRLHHLARQAVWYQARRPSIATAPRRQSQHNQAEKNKGDRVSYTYFHSMSVPSTKVLPRMRTWAPVKPDAHIIYENWGAPEYSHSPTGLI